MQDYEVRNIRTKKTLKKLENVIDITIIPMGCKRVWFKDGSNIKIKAYYELIPITKER